MALAFGTNTQVAVPGTYVYTYQPNNLPAPGAILPVGTNTLDVAFTPTDTQGYKSATGSTTTRTNTPTTPTITSITSSRFSQILLFYQAIPDLKRRQAVAFSRALRSSAVASRTPSHILKPTVVSQCTRLPQVLTRYPRNFPL